MYMYTYLFASFCMITSPLFNLLKSCNNLYDVHGFTDILDKKAISNNRAYFSSFWTSAVGIFIRGIFIRFRSGTINCCCHVPIYCMSV